MSPFCLSDTAAQVGKPSAQACSDTDRCLDPVLAGSHIMPASAFADLLENVPPETGHDVRGREAGRTSKVFRRSRMSGLVFCLLDRGQGHQHQDRNQAGLHGTDLRKRVQGDNIHRRGGLDFDVGFHPKFAKDRRGRQAWSQRRLV
jgi:hypothetical protein